MSALKLRADEEQKQSKEKQALILSIFSRLLELLTLRHRLIEAAAESAQLGRSAKGAQNSNIGSFTKNI